MCPLFFPLLVSDKEVVARELWRRGVGAIQFWNHGAPGSDAESGPDARFLRRHVLELPIHQDLGASQIAWMGEQLLHLRSYFHERHSVSFAGIL